MTYLQSAINRAGYGLGWTASRILAVGNRIVGGLISRVFSTSLQRFWFIAVARYNALLVVGFTTVSVSVAGLVFPHSEFVTVLLALTALPLLGMWLRLTPNASFIVTSCYGRQLRVHLPETSLELRDIVSFRKQTESLIRIAQLSRAATLHFDSPLLVADSTREHLLRFIQRAASNHRADIRIDVENAYEVDAVAQGSLSGHAKRYDDLREGRLLTGPNGRLMSRKVLVRMRHA